MIRVKNRFVALNFSLGAGAKQGRELRSLCAQREKSFRTTEKFLATLVANGLWISAVPY